MDGVSFGRQNSLPAYFQAKALWQEKHYKAPEAPKDGPTTQAPQDDGKVTITNLSDAKEVDYTKE